MFWSPLTDSSELESLTNYSPEISPSTVVEESNKPLTEVALGLRRKTEDWLGIEVFRTGWGSSEIAIGEEEKEATFLYSVYSKNDLLYLYILYLILYIEIEMYNIYY
jgi:hypothetical protein